MSYLTEENVSPTSINPWLCVNSQGGTGLPYHLLPMRVLRSPILCRFCTSNPRHSEFESTWSHRSHRHIEPEVSPALPLPLLLQGSLRLSGGVWCNEALPNFCPFLNPKRFPFSVRQNIRLLPAVQSPPCTKACRHQSGDGISGRNQQQEGI